ncbi:conserved hypothetical protein [Capnocytophaga canis]|uniref:Lipoprotein n=2 Tax=Capnocytophaga canis TaxID=1848903 RepID=A0A0B7I5J3_9FLAO|nr:conserved hypothetical protein [Capnocytophaga canis]
MIMKQIGILLGVLFLFSCKNSVDEIKVSEEALLNTQQAEALLQSSQNSSVFDKNLGLLNATSASQLPTTGSSGVTLNPPHGAPGHRCDIPVGAPLPNSSNMPQNISQHIPVSENEALPQVSSEGFAVPQTASLSVDSRGVKLNPPHGEPDHRCDIPVGAPLDSKPMGQVVNQQNQSVEPQVAPQQIVVDPQSTQQNVGVTAEGFSGKPNPPHGEPGHRCDIAVGAILP